MILEEYTMKEAVHKHPKYDVYYFVTTNYGSDATPASRRYHSIMWIDRPNKKGDGKIVTDYRSKTILKRDYDWKASPATDARSRAMAQVFRVIFDPNPNNSERVAINLFLYRLKTA